jgi:hypothetical protein
VRVRVNFNNTANVRSSAGWWPTIGPVLCCSPLTNGYAGYAFSNGAISILKYPEFSRVDGKLDFVPTDEDLYLELRRSGDTLEFRAWRPTDGDAEGARPETPQLTWTDNSYHFGRAGFLGYSFEGNYTILRSIRIDAIP